MTGAVYLVAGLLALIAGPATLWLFWESGSAMAALASSGSVAGTSSTLAAIVATLVLVLLALFFAFARRVTVAVILWTALLTPGIWNLGRRLGHADTPADLLALILAGALAAIPVVLVLRGTFRGRRWR
jgi:hypothetical protein